MSPGSNTESYPAFARIGLRENPGKNLNQVTCPKRDSNPGHLVSRPDALTVTPQVWTCMYKILELPIAFNFLRLEDLTCHVDNRTLNCTTPLRTKAIGLEVNPENTKYMIISRDQNIVRNGNIKIGKFSFEEVEKFKYLGATSAILPVLLYGCETWTLNLRDEQRLRVFENKVLRKIFAAKTDEVTGEWRKLHNAELHSLYSSPDIIRNIKSRRLRWAGHVTRMDESRNAYRVLVGRPEGKRPFGKPIWVPSDSFCNPLISDQQYSASIPASTDALFEGRYFLMKSRPVFIAYSTKVFFFEKKSKWLSRKCAFSDMFNPIRKNNAEDDQKEKKKLTESLAKEKLPTKGPTERNGERKKRSGAEEDIR
ncbi:hypothetical protein ANN_11224 [Periplaneta americana]|uniref:Uncharacterized protein n=1 Tax=Periplaneta americana TaxID=6978 RepID=A0ABQ8T4F3_PERAM|nr:hypothetical protein ANN_11224 [Periplaneta americana]